MSLFLKIFLWFWLAMALVVGAVTLVNWSTRSEPLAQQWQTFVGEAVNVNSQTAVQIYENEGVVGLETYLRRLSSRQRINSVALFDAERNRIAGDLTLEGSEDLFQRALQTDEPVFLRLTDKTYSAKQVRLENGNRLIYALELKRFQPPPFFTTRLLLQVLAVVLTAGLGCYALARHLASPIAKLRKATKELASGNLKARVAPSVGSRSDELSKLADDFDDMAERIESLISSEKRLTQDISHELRSPLARMNVALELFRKKAVPGTESLVERLEKESERLNDLISQLLTLSKLETGTARFEKNRLNLARIVESVVADSDFEARAQNRSVEILRSDDVSISGNESLIRRALENVVRNAVRYTEEGSRVEVSLVANGKDAYLKIRDHGEGVPEGDLGKMFKPFYRVQEARDRKSGGVGLGLAIAEQAVNHHEGRIEAKNEDPGLEVTITLPIHPNGQ